MDKIILVTEQYTKQHPQELFINKTEKTCQALMVYHFVKTKTCIKEMVDKNDFTDLEPCLENLVNLILISKDAKDLYLQTKCEELIEGAEKKLKTARLPRESKANIHSTLANMQIYFGNIQKALDEIDQTAYLSCLQRLASVKWNTIKKETVLNKKIKTTSYLLQKGYESNLIRTVLVKLQDLNET
jgi:SOS response regulatory protein OraA/RecX